MPIETAAFWSYVQSDDEADQGRITGLASHLRSMFRVRTAEELDLFLDRESIEWGTEWSERIEDAIAGTTFFIPMITPSYFKSSACRKELMKFTREASRLGLDQLLLPIYWVTVDELHEDPEESSDEAIRLVASHQWQDLRDVRLEDEKSAEYRKAVDLLASEIARRAKEISDTVEDNPGLSPSEASAGNDSGVGASDEEDGILERIAEGEVAMPALTSLMEEIGSELEAIATETSESKRELDEAASKEQGIKGRLRVTEKLANRLNGPTAKLQALGHDYARLLGESDNGVKAHLELLEEVDADEITDENREFLTNLIGLASAADQALGLLEEMAHGGKDMARLSRSMKRPMSQLQAGIRGIVDGKGIIEDWGRRASRMVPADRLAGGVQENGGSSGIADR
jgi:hypothetical protein